MNSIHAVFEWLQSAEAKPHVGKWIVFKDGVFEASYISSKGLRETLTKDHTIINPGMHRYARGEKEPRSPFKLIGDVSDATYELLKMGMGESSAIEGLRHGIDRYYIEKGEPLAVAPDAEEKRRVEALPDTARISSVAKEKP